MNKDKRCKNCKDTYEVHVQYILDGWDSSDPQRYAKANAQYNKIECGQFKPMDNLELLEWLAACRDGKGI
jgi:hypothetical protein